MNHSSNTLRWALKGNATFSLFSGISLLLLSNRLAALMGISKPLVLTVIGISLILFALVLIQTALARQIKAMKVYTIILLDGIWVFGSLIILFLRPFSLNPIAYWIIGGIAGIVALLGFWQYQGVRKMTLET